MLLQWDRVLSEAQNDSKLTTLQRCDTNRLFSHTHTHTLSNKLSHVQYGWHESLCMCTHIYLISITWTWPKAHHGYTCNFVPISVYSYSHTGAFTVWFIYIIMQTHICAWPGSLSLSLSHTHTHTWLLEPGVIIFDVMYSSWNMQGSYILPLGLQQTSEKLVCVCCNLWYARCAGSEYYLIIIFQYFHLFNLHNILLLHFQRFSYVCVCGVLQMGIIVFEWERYSVQTVWPIWIWIKLWNSRNESGQGRKKRGKGRRRGCGVVSLESGRGETRAREGPDCQSIVIIMWVNCN